MNHWQQRLYGDPERERIEDRASREELIEWTTHRIADAIEFGEFIYTVMISQSPRPFNGTVEWFDIAFDEGWIPRPRRGAWPRAFVRQALIIVNGHTNEHFHEWLATRKGTKGISLHSYTKWLSGRCSLAPTLVQTDRMRRAMLVRSKKSSVR